MLRVTIVGRLQSRDVGRLEHACAPALLSHRAPLELDLRRLTSADETAVAMLTRLVRRGAQVRGGAGIARIR